jgi:hypothetical protein
MSLNTTMEDNSQSMIISKFKGKDFPIWKRKMLAYLALKGLSGIVTGEEKVDDKSKARANSAYAILLLCLADDQARLVIDIESGDAYGLWKSLEQIYECKTTLSLVHTRRLLYNCKMKKMESFDFYLAGLKELIGKLEDMGEKVSKSEKIFILLNGLPHDYSSIVSAMEINDKITFEIACDNIRNFQTKLSLADKVYDTFSTDGYAAFVSKITCFTCGKTGHKAYKCELNKDARKCEHCEKLGHTTENCRLRGDKEGTSLMGVQL